VAGTQESRWDKWRKNGRLATLALVIVCVFWYYYTKTTPKIDRDPLVNQMVWLMAGAWVANIAYGVQQAQQKREEVREERTVAAESRAEAAQVQAVTATQKATDANTEATDANTKATDANTRSREAIEIAKEGEDG
jgi:hypothetical protein